MKVRMKDRDGVLMTRYINPRNYDPERMEVIELNTYDRRVLDGPQ